MRVRLIFAAFAAAGGISSSIVLMEGCGGGGEEPTGLADTDASTGTSTGGPRPDASTTTTADGDAGTPTCTTATTGCACDDAGAEISCGQVHRVSGDYVSCSPGFITCGVDGVWGACLGDRVGDPAGPNRGFILDSLQVDASGCVGNPCDPTCQQFVDTASGVDAGLDSGLVWNDSGVSLSPIFTDAGPSCTGITVSPATNNIVVDAFNPFHATYGSGSAYSISAQPSGCYQGTPPALYSISRNDVATMDSTTGAFAVVVGEAEPITITAFSGAFSNTATANVTVNALDTSAAGSYANASTYFPSSASTADPAAILYPNPNTMFPLGLPPPLVQWSTGGSPASAVKITLRYPSTGTPTFTWSAITNVESPASTAISELAAFSPTLPAAPRFDIPQIVWSALEQTAKGGSAVTLAIQRYYGSTTHKEVPITFQFATGQLKGTVYYNSYGTNLVKNYGNTLGGQTFGAATLGVNIGTSTPNLVAGYASAGTSGQGCRVCHSVAANGGYLVTQEFLGGNVITDYDSLATTPATASVIPGGYNNGTMAWGALEPNGTYLYANESPLSGANNSLNSALYNPVTGALITSNAPPLHAGMPTYSGDGKHVAFNFYSGNGGSLGASLTGDAKKLAMMDFAPTTKTFSNLRILHAPSGTDTYPDYWPSFFPLDAGGALDGVVFEREILNNGRDFAATRSTCDGTGTCNNSGTEAELWWASTDSSPTAARMVNANGPTLTTANAHSIDPITNYEPTVLPVLTGGYAWMVFTSRRVFGNVATINPYWSDPRYQNLTVQPTTKKLWVAAINVNAPEGTDPSFSAFYLPGQELLAGNSRGYYVLNSCAPAGLPTSTCTSDLDCCGAPTTARCVVDTGTPTNPPSEHCIAVPSSTSCAPDGTSCALVACCGALTGSQCVSNVCTAPPPLVSYSGASFTRDYVGSCPSQYVVQWQYFSWQSNTPLDSTIVFTAQTADTSAGFLSASNPAPVQIGTARQDTNYVADGWPNAYQTPTWVASANTVNNDFLAASPAQFSHSTLRVTARLTPSTSPKETPVLQDWRASYDCVPSQ
jgi:hypothetical protein